MQKKTLFLARAASIACVYVVLTLTVGWLGYGPIQFRLSEALTILPLFYLEAIPGLAIGCLVANIFSTTPIDMLFGTLATLLAAILTRLSKKIYIGIWPPIVLNALIVPLIFILDPSSLGDAPISPYHINMLTIGASQLLIVGVIGTIFYFLFRPAVERIPTLRPITWTDLRGKSETMSIVQASDGEPRAQSQALPQDEPRE